MLKTRHICSINYVNRCPGNNDVSRWSPVGIKLRFFRKPFSEISLLFIQWFLSKKVINWTSLKKVIDRKKRKKYGFTLLKKCMYKFFLNLLKSLPT